MRVCTSGAGGGAAGVLAGAGGGEFVCVLENTSIDDAIARCRAFVQALNAAPIHVDTRAFQVRGS
ncbi:hypothetical protein, partial [Paraburkholderia sp. Ac-20340]|uniref:hypothetical protein n=1 Tax=Paraburkholderia sp. Ac-20340 TaxID=2703888 RepID=UPI001F11E58E